MCVSVGVVARCVHTQWCGGRACYKQPSAGTSQRAGGRRRLGAPRAAAAARTEPRPSYSGSLPPTQLALRFSKAPAALLAGGLHVPRLVGVGLGLVGLQGADEGHNDTTQP